MQLNFIIKTLQLASLFKIMRFRATRKWSIVEPLAKPLTKEIAKIERPCKRFRSERKEALILNASILPRLKMNEMAASYISDLVQVHYPLRSLRSASNGLTLQQPYYHTQTYGAGSFAVVAPSLWNRLPVDNKKRVSMGLSVSRKMARRLTVGRKN